MRTNSKDGSVNETMILTSINRHRYKDLDAHWKKHIGRMFKNIRDEDMIIANYYEHKDAKPDIEIIVNKRKVLLSIKSGHSPSVHSEPIRTFFDFLRSNKVPERIIKIISFYHYGYSLTKRVADHILSRDEIIERYPLLIKEVNDYFLNHQELIRELIYRSIIRGRMKRDLMDYLYYGNSTKGFLLSITDIIRLISEDKNKDCKSICFNSLTYVSCARKADSPNRHHIKINWPVLCKWFYDDKFMNRYG